MDFSCWLWDVPAMCGVGHIDHSARVMRVITWNRSFKGIPNVDDGKDDFDSEEHETHATVLDKMLAWEKKLFDEVKVCCSVSYSFIPSSIAFMFSSFSLRHCLFVFQMFTDFWLLKFLNWPMIWYFLLE